MAMYNQATQYGQWPTTTQPTNNLWVGNNYSGYSPNRSFNQSYLYPTSQTYQPPMNNILEVMGADSAEEFRIGPNSRVILTDVNRPVIYMKHSDDSGYAETRAFRLTEIPLHAEPIPTKADISPASDAPSLYATREELSDLKLAVDELKKMLEELTAND